MVRTAKDIATTFKIEEMEISVWDNQWVWWK